MKVETKGWYSERVYVQELSDYLTPSCDGIERDISKLRDIVGKLAAVLVENKLMTLQAAQWLARETTEPVKLIED